MDTQWGIKPDKDKVLMLAQREVAVFVYDAVNLEGICFTLPEIQTLLEGITVGGHKLSDQQIAINQGNAWRHLFVSIKENSFRFNKDYVCQLHAIAAKEEVLQWATFRTSGVTIAGTQYTPPNHSSLEDLFNVMISEVESLNDIYDQAISVFLLMSRYQFFYDVNKRMGRFLMNAILLNNGYPAINLPAKRQLELNQLMIEFYDTGDKSSMNQFMRSCFDKRIIKIMLE